MPADAKLLIVGSVLPETAAPGEPIMFYTDMNMLVNSGGRERTESHFRTLLAETGFAVESVARKAAGPLSMIEATPVRSPRWMRKGPPRAALPVRPEQSQATWRCRFGRRDGPGVGSAIHGPSIDGSRTPSSSHV